jgi:hypothetical protein
MWKSFLCAAGLAVAACSTSTGPAATQILHLASVNDAPLPVVVDRQPGQAIEVSSSTLRLFDNGTFSNVMVFRIIVAGVASEQQSDTTTGTYASEGSTVTLTAAAGEHYVGTFDSSGLRYLSESGRTYRYVRE